MDNFIEIAFTMNNLDRFYHRSSILKAISESLPIFKGKFLDLGCGEMPYKAYILEKAKISNYLGIDIENQTYQKVLKPDLFWDGIKIPLDDNSVDTVMATELFEHLPNTQIVLNEIYRVLKPEGLLFFTIPFLWPLHDIPYDEFRYTPFSIERYLKSSNFNRISIKAQGGWHASMAQMMGLWVRRAPLHPKVRLLLSLCFKPIIKYLIKKEGENAATFTESQMITGIYGTAKK